VYISNVRALTGERELRVVLSCDLYNASPGCVTVLVAEIETGTRLRATQHGIETNYGIILADRIVWNRWMHWANHSGRSPQSSDTHLSQQAAR
ncbi:MAG: hypothetical protein ACRDPW_06505, partial [Mycobacteriales bacterium]